MDLFNKEEAVETVKLVETVAPVEAVAPIVTATPVKFGVECTRDTRGEAPCDVKDCENCN